MTTSVSPVAITVALSTLTLGTNHGVGISSRSPGQAAGSAASGIIAALGVVCGTAAVLSTRMICASFLLGLEDLGDAIGEDVPCDFVFSIVFKLVKSAIKGTNRCQIEQDVNRGDHILADGLVVGVVFSIVDNATHELVDGQRDVRWPLRHVCLPV